MQITKKVPYTKTLFNIPFILILCIISFAAIFLTLNIRSNCYQNLFILPLSYFLSLTITSLYLNKANLILDIPVTFVILLYFIRNVITPIVMATVQSKSMLGDPTYDDANKCIYMMAYETMAVFIFIAAYKSKHHFTKIHKNTVKFKGNNIYWISIVSAVVICVLSFILVPELRSQYYSIFNNTFYTNKEVADYSLGTINRLFYTGGQILIEVMRIILPASVIYLIASKKQSNIRLCVCIFIIALQFIFMTDSNAYILMVVLTQLILVFKLFPQKRKIIFSVTIILSLTFGILLYMHRFSQDHYGGNLGIFLQAYFPGISNFAGMFKVDRSNSFVQIFYDLYSAIPFRSTLFGYSGGLDSLSTLWNSANNITGQIMPTIAQSYFYGGALLSPAISCILVYISFKAYNAMKNTQNAMSYTVYTYMMLYSVVSVTMYNGEIFFKCFMTRMLFSWLFARMSTYEFKKIS